MKGSVIGIIPAGGKGSRLAPFPCPKELFPVGYQDYQINGIVHRRPKVVSQYLIENILAAGATSLFIIVSSGKGDIMKYYGNGSRFNTSISYLYQEIANGMANAIDLAYTWVKDVTVLFGMPDTIIEPSNVFEKLIQEHEYKMNDLTLGLFSTETPSKFGMVEIDKHGSVISTIDKPENTNLGLMWGCACWQPSFTQLINTYLIQNKTAAKEVVLGDIFNEAIGIGMKVGGVTFSKGKYIDIGTSEELDIALKKFHL